MSVVLLDTNIVSFIFKGSDYADPYEPLLTGRELAISFMSIGELYHWAFTRQWGVRRITELEKYLSNYLIIPSDQALCQEWGRLRAEAHRTGRAISAQDAWIAATAIRHDLELVTHNLKDFQGLANLRLILPNQR
jgi:tRNA(fMet)-specific endonuclease VapC